LTVSYSYLGGQIAVEFSEKISNLKFTYGYESNRIQFIKGAKSYTLGEAFDYGIINNDDLHALYKMHTNNT